MSVLPRKPLGIIISGKCFRFVAALNGHAQRRVSPTAPHRTGFNQLWSTIGGKRNARHLRALVAMAQACPALPSVHELYVKRLINLNIIIGVSVVSVKTRHTQSLTLNRRNAIQD